MQVDPELEELLPAARDFFRLPKTASAREVVDAMRRLRAAQRTPRLQARTLGGDLRDELEHLVGDPGPDPVDESEEAREKILADARRWLGLADDAPLEAIQGGFRDEDKFWIWFFPDWRKDRLGREVPGAPFQDQLARRVCALLRGETEEDTLAVACPREHSKTTRLAFVPMLYAAAHKMRRYQVYLSNTADLARGVVADIRTELEMNDRLQAVFPALCSFLQKPRVNYLVLGTECVIACAGVLKAIRGARWRQYRPDAVYGDDMEKDDQVNNEKLRKKLMNFWNKVARKLGRTAVYVILGTILHAESFLRKQVEREADVFKAVVSYPDELNGLWAQWEIIFRDRGREERRADARRFYTENRQAMDAGAEVLWPERFGLYELMVERTVDLASFMSERQNDPFDPAGSYFGEVKFRTPAELATHGDVVASVGTWDPSLGKKKSDTSAVPRLDLHVDGTKVVSWGIADRKPPEEVMDTILAAHQVRAFDAFRVEDVGLSTFTEQLQKKAVARGSSIIVSQGKPDGNKDVRIRSRRPQVVADELQFSDALPPEAKQQIGFYGQHPHDDFWDAVDAALRLLDELTLGVEAAGATGEPDPDGGRIEAPVPPGVERPAHMPRAGERVGLLDRLFGRA